MTGSRSRAALRLSLVAEPGDPRLVVWRERCDPAELWQAVVRGGVGIPDRWHDAAADAVRAADAALRRAEGCGARWIAAGTPGWPVALEDLDHLEGIGQVTGSPLGLWVRGGGDLTTIAAAPIAVVGARGCTTYGAEAASDIAADCADQGYAVVSGAAFGIDACAHRGALLGGGPTVAVMACGVDVDYPRAHAALLHRIAEEGLVISEFPPGSEPQRHRFLVRNRIIAALSVGVVVVEAAARSGSLNTLHWADQLGRTTMAVPGPITSQASCGTHRAVRDGKALLVTSGRDVVADTFGLVDDDLPQVGPGARRVWVRLGAEPVPAEQIAAALRLSPVAVHRALRELARHGVASAGERGWSRHIGHSGDDGRVG
ncbi:DNA processing protein DprA [Aeromicrobium flavum]|uniref:DNA processing protein DprA n=1 Tax=Aeromicrobium flavum TaxID=416568 RepID=A0A512HWR2_9ACTN|nr:DNA-processing protein DprA [Aeromicrobium flavum]GEO89887.1 DNA processing protein DprA [Aeromicrobium flavum]